MEWESEGGLHGGTLRGIYLDQRESRQCHPLVPTTLRSSYFRSNFGVTTFLIDYYYATLYTSAEPGGQAREWGIMTQEPLQFISVPVPAEHVAKVYALLAELAGTAAPVKPAGDTEDDWPHREWALTDLRALTADPMDSVQEICRVLDIMAKQPGQKVSYTALVNQLGVERKRLQGVLSAFSRVLHKHYDRGNWPMTWAEAPSDEPGFKSEYFYTLDETTAERWLQVRAQS